MGLWLEIIKDVGSLCTQISRCWPGGETMICGMSVVFSNGLGGLGGSCCLAAWGGAICGGGFDGMQQRQEGGAGVWTDGEI